MVDGEPTQAERTIARSMLSIRDGKARHRAPRVRRVTGLLALGSAAAFVGFAVVGWVPALAFLIGAVGGGATWMWIAARDAEVRQRVVLQVCDWERVERLAGGEQAGPRAAADGGGA